MRVALLLALLSAASASAADDVTVEERLKKLEQEVADLKLENQQLRRDLGLEVVARQSDVKMNGRAEAVQLGGLIQMQGESGDRPDTRFSTSNGRVFLRRARVNMSGRFIEEFNFRAELELAGSLTDATGLRAQMTDAFVNWNRFDSANVRVGQFKTPYGFEQLYADPRLYTAERSLMSDRLTPGRQIGVQLGGEWMYERINYAIGVFNGNGTNSNFNDNNRFLSAARLSVVPLSGRLFEQQSRWSIGVDGFRSNDTGVTVAPELSLKSNLFTGRRCGVGLDTQVELGPLEIWAEALRGTYEPNGAASFQTRGAYGQIAYYAIMDKLQFVGRYETFDPNERVSLNTTRASTLGMNYYFKQHDLKLQLDVLRGHGTRILARLQTAF
jgi:phosphate-selective porin OprO and OprP